jgi:hypothetical protein
MFDIKEQDVLGQTNKLLFNIWQELKNNRIIIPEIKPEEIGTTTILPLSDGTGNVTICSYCGKDHSNVGFAMACARRKKKEGVSNE